MKLMIFISAPHLAQSNGSTSYTCLISAGGRGLSLSFGDHPPAFVRVKSVAANRLFSRSLQALSPPPFQERLKHGTIPEGGESSTQTCRIEFPY